MSNINQLVQESFDWKPSTLYVHQLVKSNPIVDLRLEKLVEMGILDNTKKVYIYSFVHPDVEFAQSFCTDTLLKSPSTKKTWVSYVDPEKLLINKREVSNGFSLEKIGEKNFNTTMFLSSGSAVAFKKVQEVQTEIISTTVILPAILINGIYNTFKVRIVDPKFPIKSIFFKAVKITTLPQFLTKANYIFRYDMVVK